MEEIELEWCYRRQVTAGMPDMLEHTNGIHRVGISVAANFISRLVPNCSTAEIQLLATS